MNLDNRIIFESTLINIELSFIVLRSSKLELKSQFNE